MSHEFTLEPTKTYATEENARRAVFFFPDTYRYIIVWNKEGRCYPLFVGANAFDVIHSGHAVVG